MNSKTIFPDASNKPLVVMLGDCKITIESPSGIHTLSIGEKYVFIQTDKTGKTMHFRKMTKRQLENESRTDKAREMVRKC